jgi:tetratricopeptide (TPR) repeat protein
MADRVASSAHAAGGGLAMAAHALTGGQAAQALRLADTIAARAPCLPDLHILRGAALSALARWADACAAFDLALVLAPDRIDARMGLGNAAFRHRDFATAIRSFSTVLDRQPDNIDATNNLGLTLTEADAPDKALPLLERAAAARPDRAQGPFNLGNCLRALDRAGDARAAYERALALDPAHWGAANNLGTLLRETGDRAGAEAAFRRALAIRPDAADTRRNLAEVKRFAPDDPDLADIRQALQHEKDPRARMHLCFALGKALDDVGAVDPAFAAFDEGNRLRRQLHPYDPAVDALLFATLRRLFDVPPPSLSAGSGSFRPVFVTGMMRSGTSLVEQILAAHPDVAAGGELEAMTRAALPVAERAAADAALRLDHVTLRGLRDNYQSQVARIAGQKPVLTDKMPLNFRWIGFILTAFPEARVLHLRRDPMAVGWSIFRTCFTARGNGWAWDQAQIGAFQCQHDAMLAFWHSRFPDRITEVDYDALTEDPDRQTRALVQAAGLSWSDRCLDFASAQTQVRTASAMQVRQGLYRGSSQQWRAYAHHLRPLADALERR